MRVTMTKLSEHLKMLPEGEGVGTSLPTVGGMIRRLSREGLVESNAAKDVLLTKHGQRSAATVVRRHRLAERLVVDLLGLELHKAHEEAHLLEHAISPALEQKIMDKLGNPTTCPFGHPIPGSAYVAAKNEITLNQAEVGQVMEIQRIPEDDQELLRYFVENDLIPGTLVRVKETASSRGVITLECRDTEVVFSYEIASILWVCPVEAQSDQSQ